MEAKNCSGRPFLVAFTLGLAIFSWPRLWPADPFGNIFQDNND